MSRDSRDSRNADSKLGLGPTAERPLTEKETRDMARKSLHLEKSAENPEISQFFQGISAIS